MIKKHRRKIALAVALILALGSAAASASNYAGGKGAMPSFAGAGDALEAALSGAGQASNWIIARSRSVLGSAFSYLPPASARPPEIASVPEILPDYPRGPVEPSELNARPYGKALNGKPDVVHQASFDALRSSPVSTSVASVDAAPSPEGGGGAGGANQVPSSSPPLATTLSASPLVAAVPEPPPFAMLLAGLGLLSLVARRHGK